MGLKADPAAAAAARIHAALARCALGGDAVEMLRQLVDAIRPPRGEGGQAAAERWRAMNELLAAHEHLRRGLALRLAELFATRRVVSFVAEAGILPNAGFFSELWRKLAHKLLPTIPDPRSLRDCVDLVFTQARDDRWLGRVPMADKLDFWRLVSVRPIDASSAPPELMEQLIEAALIVSHRATGLGLEPELRRVCPEVEERESPFLAMHLELRQFVESMRASLADPATARDDGRHVLVLTEQCRSVLARAYRVATTQGASLPLTYLLRRLEQHLDRLELLVGALGAPAGEAGRAQVLGLWAELMRVAVQGQIGRNSIRRHFDDLIGLLALRVTENASRAGEHYIAGDWAAYRTMWRSAMGAGAIIAVMALIKTFASRLELAPAGYAVTYSLIYGAGFVLVALLHFTIATKQPAMTAATLAAAVSQSRGKLADIERVVNLVADTVRSQIAAILGNVALAMSTAVAVAWVLTGQLGVPVMDADKARHLLHEIHPFDGPTLWYAAVAGVWLFVAGLVSGSFDNSAAYSHFGERVARLRWLRAVLGPARAERLGAYLHDNLGAIGGNFVFGCLLGSTGTLGFVLGLPLDIRHVAFASANLAYALWALGGELSIGDIAIAALGVALIGAVNLGVSFALALWVALRSRDATFASASELPGRLLARWRERPGSFFVPPRGASGKG